MQLLLRVRILLILNDSSIGKKKLVLICSCLMLRKRSEKTNNTQKQSDCCLYSEKHISVLPKVYWCAEKGKQSTKEQMKY